MIEYLTGLKNAVFKILPLKEEENEGLQDYLDSLFIRVTGALTTFPELRGNLKYISVVNTIAYFKDNTYTFKQCRREILNCCNILKGLVEDELN